MGSVTLFAMNINDDTRFPSDAPTSPEVTTNARRRARVRLLPLLAVLVGVLAAVGANLLEAPQEQAVPYALSSVTTEPEVHAQQDAASTLTAPTTSSSNPSTTQRSNPSTTSSVSATTSSSPSSPAGTTATSKIIKKDAQEAGVADNTSNRGSDVGREPSTTWSTTPEPELGSGSFNGNDFGYGAVVGRDVKAGRYWSSGCVGWRHFDEDRLISTWRRAQQSLVDLRNGETLLSNCHWNAGNPPAAEIIPTGKVSLVSQLTPGKYRPKNEICMTGPADTRSTDAIADSSEYFAWESKPADHVLVITGRENWVAYGISAECGGLVRIG
jgi:hypothetical protein